MKAPVTTHDLLLLAESKLSCTNVRNSDKRTQTAGLVFVIAMRINHGEYLPVHSWSSVSQTSPALPLSYSNGRVEREGQGEREKETEGTQTRHQRH